MKKLIYKYVVYIIYFLGIGMTSSGIVLMPFNTFRYSTILGIGLALFIAGSVFNEVVIDKNNLSLKQSIKLVVFSLTLAIGIGMISGGISHFKESPVYVSFLIPIGIIISFISFTVKNNYKLSRKEKFTAFAGFFWVALIVYTILTIMAGNYSTNIAPGGDIFKNMNM